MKSEYKELLPYILKDENSEQFTVRVLLGSDTCIDFSRGDIASVRDCLHRHEGGYTERTFPSIEEAAAYAMGLLDASEWDGIQFIPASTKNLCWLQDNENCRWIDRIYVPEYAVALLTACQTDGEFIDTYGEKDYENYNKWRKEYDSSIGTDEKLIFQLVDDNLERPNTYFDSRPIFGLPCDTVQVDVYAILRTGSK